MKGIKNIIFDLGGVFINLDNQRTEDAFVAKGVKRFKEFFGHGHADAFFKEYEVGKINDAQFIANIKSLADIDLADEDVIQAWNVMLLDFPEERITLLKKLAKKYRIFLFSNTNAMHYAAVRDIYRDAFSEELDDHFEKTYYSHLMGMRKPTVESFRHIIDENGLNAGETLFVDDALINVRGAEAAGLKGLFLQPGTTVTDIDWGI
jgi:HAD superfamily hydrolase (TIGR01509 family)